MVIQGNIMKRAKLSAERLKKIGLTIIAGVVILIVGLGIVAPRHFRIEKQLVIDRPSHIVFEKLKTIKTHVDWNPWTKKDRNIKFDYKGVDGTVGFIAAWKGNNDVGEGEQEIKNIIEGKRIDLELRFKKPMEATNQSYFIVEPMYEQQTNVKWGMIGKLSFPGNVIYMLANVPKKLGYDFDEGLRVFKAILEKKPEKQD